MEILHKQIKPNFPALKQYIMRVTASELTKLVEPCYYPKTKKFYFEILNLLGLTPANFQEFVKRTYKGTKAEKWKLWLDPATNLLVFVMHLFLLKNDRAAFSSTVVYYMIVQYARLMYKQMKYCNEDTFRYTLDHITKTHLFYREKTIANSLYYLSQVLQKPFMEDIKKWNVDRIIDFIGVSRHRISQSVKSFAETYYEFRKQGIGIKTQIEEPQNDESNMHQYIMLKRGQRIADQVLKKIVVYKEIDRKAFDEAISLTKIKTSIATLIIQKLSNQKNTENIKIVIELFLKDLKEVSMICGKDFYTFVKSLMGIKRTKAQVYFKSQINILLMTVLKELNYVKEYNNYNKQVQYATNLFLAFYITLIIRHSMC